MRTSILLLIMAMALVACGGDDSSGGNGSVDIVEIPTDQLNEDDLPAFFADFAFSEDWTLRQVFSNDQQASISGRTSEAPDVVHASVVEELTAAGYELLSNEANFAAFIRDGVGRVRVRTSESDSGASVSIDIDRWTDEQIEELRVLSAPEVRSPGVATVDLDGYVSEVAGECIVQGRNLNFVADDASLGANVNEFADPPQAYAEGYDEAGFLYYTAFDPQPDYEIHSMTAPVSYTVSGSSTSSDTDARTATVGRGSL